MTSAFWDIFFEVKLDSREQSESVHCLLLLMCAQAVVCLCVPPAGKAKAVYQLG